ncbi:MAG TPA: AsmA-like C-terminal region-containing protein, partial [Terrimicrobiaceae bacterium]
MLIFVKRLVIFVAGVAVLAAIVLLCINLYLQSGGVQQRIRDAAYRALGSEVKIQSTMYTPWSGLVIRGISVPDPENANLNSVEAEALRVRVSFRELTSGRIVITECTLFQPKVIVRQLANGDWVLPLHPERPQVQPAPREPSLPAPKGFSFKTELHNVRLRGGSIIFLNAKNRAIVTLEKTDLSAQIAPDHSATGVFEIGRADFFGSIKPRKIGGPFTWKGKVLDMPEVLGSLAGGKITGKYHIATSEQPSFALALQLSSVLLKKLAEEAHVEHGKTEGVLQGSLELTGDPRDSSSLTGGGHFELVSAKFKPIELLAKLGDLLQVDELQMLKLSDARVDATILDERVQVDDMVLKSDNLILRGSGPVRFNGKMNLDVTL